MAYIDTKYLGKCDTCRHFGNGGCNTYCDHGEEYSPNLSKIPTADVAPKSEVAREIIDDFDEELHKLAERYYEQGKIEYFTLCEVIYQLVIAKIKKKYTEGE